MHQPLRLPRLDADSEEHASELRVSQSQPRTPPREGFQLITDRMSVHSSKVGQGGAERT